MHIITISALAAAALSADPRVEGQPPASAPDEWIIVSISPHWRPAEPGPTTHSYSCGGHTIAFRLARLAPSGDAPARLEMHRLSVDGRRIGRERLAAINSELASFGAPPEINVQCARRQIRIMLEERERGRVLRSHPVPLVRPQ